MVAKSVCHGKGCNLILSVGPSVWYAGDVANLRKQDVRGRAEVRPGHRTCGDILTKHRQESAISAAQVFRDLKRLSWAGNGVLCRLRAISAPGHPNVLHYPPHHPKSRTENPGDQAVRMIYPGHGGGPGKKSPEPIRFQSQSASPRKTGVIINDRDSPASPQRVSCLVTWAGLPRRLRRPSQGRPGDLRPCGV